jgi:hypothetical protein
MFLFFLVPIHLSVRKNNFRICQFTHSPHVLTREVQGKREREMENLLVPETDKNMFKNKLCSSQQKQHTPKKILKNKQTSITKTNSPCIMSNPTFFSFRYCQESVGTWHWLKFRRNSHHEGGREGKGRAMGGPQQQPQPLSQFVSYGSKKKVRGFLSFRKPLV